MPTSEPESYQEAIRTFDHEPVSRLPAYADFRRLLDQVAAEAGTGGMSAAEFFAAVFDSAFTTPFADNCEICDSPSWPYAVNRDDGGWITGKYRCARGHRWECGWSTEVIEYLGTADSSSPRAALGHIN